MLKLSRHFIENWKYRVGGTPDPGEISKLIEESVRVQPCRDLLWADTHTRFRQLAIYWIPKKDIIIKVDEFKGVAVTVLSKKNGGKKEV